MFPSVLEEIMSSMLASATTEVHTHVAKTGGEVLQSKSEPYKHFALPPIQHDPDDPWTTVSVSVGKTVDIGNKESARVTASLTCAVRVSDRSEAFATLSEFVWEVVDREVLSVTQPDVSSPEVVYPFNDNRCPRVTTGLDYGLTINMGDWEFTKPNIGASNVTTSSGWQEAYTSLSFFLSEQMKHQVKKAKYGSAVDAL